MGRQRQFPWPTDRLLRTQQATDGWEHDCAAKTVESRAHEPVVVHEFDLNAAIGW